MLRSLFLFLHVASAMGVFAALGIEGVALLQLRRAVSTADLSAALHGFRLVRRVGALSLATVVLSGVYLATAVWGWRGAWIGVGFAGLLLTGVIGATATGRRIARLQVAANDARGGAPTRRPHDHHRDPILWVSFKMRVAILIGIVFLMTVKPGLEGSLVAMTVAIAAGLLASLMDVRCRTLPTTGTVRRAT